MRIVWSLFAPGDREAIFTYIESDSPRTAARIDDQIESQVKLGQHAGDRQAGPHSRYT